jgi:hypothetical protein
MPKFELNLLPEAQLSAKKFDEAPPEERAWNSFSTAGSYTQTVTVSPFAEAAED